MIIFSFLKIIKFDPNRNVYRFCAKRLYSTYEDRRSTPVVLISRWTFTFYLLHNLTAIASYAAYVTGRIPEQTHDPETVSLVQRSLDEVLLLLIVLAIPVSYLIGVLGQCCCSGRGQSAEVEMAKMDKIYQEVRVLIKAFMYHNWVISFRISDVETFSEEWSFEINNVLIFKVLFICLKMLICCLKRYQNIEKFWNFNIFWDKVIFQ